MASNTYKTFTKDGKTRVAYTPADAVALRFDGWVEERDETTAKPAPKPAAPAAKTDGGTQTR